MTSTVSINNPKVEIHQPDNITRPEFSGGTTLLAVMALYSLQNLLLKVMKLYSQSIAEQKNTSLAMAAESGKNIKDSGSMQATSMILAGIGSIAGAALAVGFTMYSSRTLRQTQLEMKNVDNKLSIVNKNLKNVEKAIDAPRSANVGKGLERRGPNGSKVLPEVVSKQDLQPHLKEIEKSKFEKVWDAPDNRHLQAFKPDAPEIIRLDKSLRSEQKVLNKRMDSLSGEHSAELNKSAQRGQLSNSAAQGLGQTSSGIPHLAKGEYDSAAQFTKAVGEQIEGSSRQSEEARNQTLQSANHINQILDQLKAAEKTN